MRVYLAGPIFQCEDHECIHWREQAKQLLNGHQAVDPMDRDYRGVTDENHRRIVEEDKALIDSCDILLVNHLKTSVGTSMEIFYAWENKKDVIVISQNGQNSPWLLYHSDKIFDSLDAAASYIKSLEVNQY